MRIARVFPTRTRATPDDELAFTGDPPFFAEADAVHISVAFTWDLPEAERLAMQWWPIAPVTIGGPACGTRGEDFTPGMYVKHGYTITSRGCPNKCWFCSVWRREGSEIRELPIHDGWNLLDDNILACSDEHIKAVFNMLSKQKRAPEFTGGLEAARLKPWHVSELRKLHPKQLFFAYDGPEDREPLHAAGKMLVDGGFTVSSGVLRAYVLIGYPHDTFEDAGKRLMECFDVGFLPMAMLYRDTKGKRDPTWMRFQRKWARPAITKSIYRRANVRTEVPQEAQGTEKNHRDESPGAIQLGHPATGQLLHDGALPLFGEP